MADHSSAFEKRVIALAERVGRLAGTLQRPLTRRKPAAPAKTAAPKGRSGGRVDAPGKKHRKPPARSRGVKHSDETIAKVVSAKQTRPARRG